jgi:hypothetical protein
LIFSVHISFKKTYDKICQIIFKSFHGNSCSKLTNSNCIPNQNFEKVISRHQIKNPYDKYFWKW